MKVTAMLKIAFLMLVLTGSASFPLRVAESLNGQSCTIVYASDARTALAGNNEDFKGRLSRIHFLPATEGKYGRVYFGFDVVHFPQGGMNEKGLFFDAATFDHTVDVPRDPKKPSVEGQLILKAMEECSTVEEVLKMFEHYDYSGRMGGQYLVGDSQGNSAIIEPLKVLSKQGRYQIATNFAQSETGSEGISDARYLIASGILEKSKDLSVDLIRRVLNATHFEDSGTATLYSYICDLKKGDIYLYNFHNFEDAARFNLRGELAKGERVLTIPSLFPYETFAQKRYGEETGFLDD